MKKYLSFLAFTCVVCLLAACDNDDSSDIDDSVSFYQDYHADYNVTRNKTYVGANFRQNNKAGEYVRLTGSASIRFNGEKPNYANIVPYFYTYTLSGLEKVLFSFTRKKGEDFVNTVSLADVSPIGIPADFTTIPTSGSTLLTWEGNPVSVNEEVQVTIITDAGVGTTYDRTVGSNSIEVEFSLRTIPKKAILQISRIKTLPVQQSNGNAGGQVKVAYSQEKEVTLQ